MYSSVGHRIKDVVNAEAIGQRSVFFRVPGLVRHLPGIAKIDVEVDDDHEATIIVVDTFPGRRVSIMFKRYAVAQCHDAGNRFGMVHVKVHAHDCIFVANINDAAIGKYFLHRTHKPGPLH